MLPLRTVVLAVVPLALALGCASTPRTRRLPASVFQGAHLHATRAAAAGARGEEGAALVVQVLHRAGLRFGTDGSTRALWGYLRTSHRLVDAADARPGDVILFDTLGTEREPECADHAGVVEAVDADGRIRFVEMRGGRLRHSFAHADFPATRRDPDARLLNTFLRPKRIDDPDGARHFAGQMICAVVRLTHD